jgi:Mg-chelatase subunit ChlD
MHSTAIMLLLLFLSSCYLVHADEFRLLAMMTKMELDTTNFAKHMEDLISKSSSEKCELLTTCSEKNYDGCVSEFPSTQCPGKDYSIKECGSGKEGGCGGLFDFTVSSVSLAPSARTTLGNEENHVIDDVCTSLEGENYMIDESNKSQTFWNEEYGVNIPWMYYGSSNGVFRMYPAATDNCVDNDSTYDPRVRPWYVAASSGPKDIVLVLDTSGSMYNYRRMEKLKLAANRVIDTLNAGDFFAVVVFNSEAMQLGDTPNLLTPAFSDDKAKIKAAVNELAAYGGTEYLLAFQKAFGILKNTVTQDMSSNCRSAILFVSDGDSQESTQDLLNYIDTEIQEYESRGKEAPVIFTYSFGDGAPEDKPKQLACSYKGVWSRISDQEDLAVSMSAYYKYFAYGLSSNTDFVTWSPPYVFSTGGGLGTTVSAPVYNRNLDPPVLAGVVGMDFSFAAMEQALNDFSEEDRDRIIEERLAVKRARCPAFELTECQRESLRKYATATSADATCGSCGSSLIQDMQNPLCQDDGKYDEVFLWENFRQTDWLYEEKTCCNVGEERESPMSLDEVQSQVCTEKKKNLAVIIGGAVAGVVGFLWALCCLCNHLG